MHLAICDDQTNELFHLTTLLDEYRTHRGNSITYEAFYSATELLEAVKERPFDLLLLDILMPGFSGIEAAREIRQWNKEIFIIFLTSSKEFAIDSYRVNAEDYILKPVQANELFPALDQLLLKMAQEESYLTLRTSDSLLRLPLAKIEYVEVINHKLHFTLVTGEKKETYGNLSDCEKTLLASESFLKPHRSYIVNLHQVTAFDKSGFTTSTGKIVPISRGLLTQSKTAYIKYLFSRKDNK